MAQFVPSPSHRLTRLVGLAAVSAALASLPLGAGSPRAAAPDESPWVRKLPGGVTVELLGVCAADADPVVWWTPDGKLRHAPVDKVLVDRTNGGQQLRAFAARVDGPSNDDLVIRWDFGKHHGGESGTGLKDGRPLRGVESAGLALPAEAKTWTIRMEFAAGAWETAVTWAPDGGVRGLPEGRHVVVTKSRELARGWTAFVVVEDYPGRHEARVVARDRDGKVFAATRGGLGWAGGGTVHVHDVELIGARPGDAHEYALQFRPLQSVEFRDVPLVAPKR